VHGPWQSEAVVEHRHLAEQVARLHQRHHRLAVVDRVGDRDGEPTAGDDVERVGRVALFEQHVATDQLPLGAGAAMAAITSGDASAKNSVDARSSS
jgi:hypothetical protein